MVGYADDDYPLQKKRHSFEFLRTLGHLRMRTNTFGAVMRVRNAATQAIHGFFQERGFIHLHSPIITLSDCEGAGEMFRVSTLDPEQAPRTDSGAVDYSQDFFGKEARLTVSGQLEAEIAALALSNVYTFGPTFRSENSNTSRHLAEFWMVEPEMAFCDIQGNQDLAEAFLKDVTKGVLESCVDDMAFFNERIDKTVLETLTNIVDQPFERMTYTEAVAILERSGRSFEYPVSWGVNLQSEHERYLVEEHVHRPVMVIDYPKEIKAFYMYLNDDERTVAAMDVLVPKIGEIIGGSQREHRLTQLKKRIRECGLPEEDYWWYLELRRYGYRAPRRLRPGLRAPDPVHDRPGKHPRRHPLPPGPGLRGVLSDGILYPHAPDSLRRPGGGLQPDTRRGFPCRGGFQTRPRTRSTGNHICDPQRTLICSNLPTTTPTRRLPDDRSTVSTGRIRITSPADPAAHGAGRA